MATTATTRKKKPNNIFAEQPPQIDFSRGMPASPEAERTILGAILLAGVTIYAGELDILKVEMFSSVAHRHIYRAMLNLANDDIPIDMITLTEELNRGCLLPVVGGVEYVSSLIDGVPDRLSIESYVKSVQNSAQLRATINICQLAIANAVQHSDSAKDVIARLEQEVLTLNMDMPSQKAVTPRESLGVTINDLKERANADVKRAAIGLTFGVPHLDAMTTGMWRKEITIFGGHTKDGKSSSAITAAIANLKDGIPVLYVSHESDRDTINLRIIAQETSVSFAKLRDPRKMNSADWDAIASIRPWLESMPLYVIDSDEMPIDMVVSMTKLHVRRDGVQLLIVDYLQQMDAPGANQAERIGNAFKGLRKLVKTENIHGLVLSQLTNPDTKDKSKVKPNPLMFRGSGSPIHDAHTAIACWRPEEDGKFTGQDEILVLLQRSGPAKVHVEMRYDTERLMYVPRNESQKSNQKEMSYGDSR